MTSRPVLVTDTNIWIDLENGGIVAETFWLPFRFTIPDFAVPELRRPSWATLAELGLTSHELLPEQVLKLVELGRIHRNLSVVDLSALLLATRLNAALLTGDRRLHELAIANGLAAHGVLWLLDTMLSSGAIPPKQAAVSLKQMVERGARLPIDECQKRLARWGA